MKTIKLLATISVTDDYFIDDPYWTLENAVSENFEEEELESVEIYEPSVIDVNLEEEFADFLEKENAYIDDNNVISYYNGSSFNHTCDIYPLAKHFFELGLKAKESKV